MDMVRHDHIPTDLPFVRFTPSPGNELVNELVIEERLAVRRTGGDKNKRQPVPRFNRNQMNGLFSAAGRVSARRRGFIVHREDGRAEARPSERRLAISCADKQLITSFFSSQPLRAMAAPMARD